MSATDSLPQTIRVEYILCALRLTTYLLGVVKTFVVILQSWNTLLLSLSALVGVHDVAAKNLLPEGKAAVRT